MFAMKAACDKLNSAKYHVLRMVATGSNRDKLTMLRVRRDQASYSAPLVSFPHFVRAMKCFSDNADLSSSLSGFVVLAETDRKTLHFQPVDQTARL